MFRYTYYHVLYVGLINIMMFVPSILIRERFTGAILGMLIAIVIGSVMALSMMVCFEHFPGLGLPEICDLYLPKWLTTFNCLLASIFIWLPAGVIVVYSYSETIRMFFYPDMNPYMNLLLMAGAAAWASSRSTRTVQFINEITTIVSSPVIFIILMKAIFGPNLNWDAIRYVSGYIKEPPSFLTVASATFLFSGYMSLTIFNRLHTEGFKFRFRWLVPLFGTLFLSVTFFVPIGFHGTVGVEKFVYLWSMTADSMVLEYGFINRVLYVFLLIFTGLSLLFVMNTWHISILLIRYALNRSVTVEEVPVPQINIWLALAAGVISFAYMFAINMERNEIVSTVWLVARFFMEIVFLTLMLYFAWRRKKEKACV
ncbi:hypothetical protein [Paenibacillus thalictri]|uniref:Uncharacterized protein n=1 Tax=Paenibacillus thalictri TaxID=2527873 RepID=A0A4Q9DM80_9BACL|nr:hypothetical protein [Paenibacillus thalictri]TBL74580.1 hypothetical protein EYB31_24975 [Paenibacillus thalictri]